MGPCLGMRQMKGPVLISMAGPSVTLRGAKSAGLAEAGATWSGPVSVGLAMVAKPVHLMEPSGQ